MRVGKASPASNLARKSLRLLHWWRQKKRLHPLRLTTDIRCVAPKALLGSRTLRGTFRFAPFFRYARTRRKFGRFRRRRAGTCLTKSGLWPDFVYPTSLSEIAAQFGRAP